MNYIVVHLITKNHLKVAKLIKKLFYNHTIVLIIEDNLKLIEKKDLPKHFKLFDMSYHNEITNFFKNKSDKISFAFLSTAQARYEMVKFIYKLLLFKIPIYAIEETHQMYLHKGYLNNYLLPSDVFFVCSEFEKKEFIKQKYNKKSIVVTGWYFDYNLNDKKKGENYSLIILNATNKNNPNIVENFKKQNLFITSIRKLISNKIIIKPHPLENKNNYNKKVIKYFDDKTNIIDLIHNSNYVFSTGYTQSIIEAIILKKNVYIYEIDKSLNIYKDIPLNLIKKNNINNFSKQFDENTYLNFKKINNLFLENKNIKNNIKKGILNSIKKLNKKKCTNYSLIEISVWLYFYKEYNRSLAIIKNLPKSNKELINKKINILSNIYNSKLNKEIIYKTIEIFKNDNILYTLKYIIFRNIILQKKDFNEEILILLKLKEPKYMSIMFYNYFQYLLTYVMTINYKEYHKIETYDSIVNRNILNTKNIVIRSLIYARKTRMFAYFPFIKIIIKSYILKKLK